jgi:integrase
MSSILRGRVSKTAVDRLRPGETLRDTDLKGFGVRRQHDAPSYFLQKKVHGRLRWFTIGPHGSPWTPERARKEAQRILYGLSAGVDPHQQKVLERGKPTVREAAEQFMASHGPKLKPRTREEYERLLKLHVVPKLGTRLIADLNKGHIAQFHAQMEKTPAGANFTLAVLSRLMRWCEDIGYRPEQSNPCRGVKKYVVGKRERFLSWEELRRLGATLTQVESDSEASLFAVAAIRLLIFTGARLNEILTLRWSYVDLQRGLLLLPDSKTGKKSIRLNAPAIDVLNRLPRLKGNPHVIVGSVHGGHLVNLQKTWRHIRGLAGLEDVRIHDLRHSFASVAAASGASLPMIGKLLGHSQPQTTARYAHLADDPLHELNQKVGDAISRAMQAPQQPTLRQGIRIRPARRRFEMAHE